METIDKHFKVLERFIMDHRRDLNVADRGESADSYRPWIPGVDWDSLPERPTRVDILELARDRQVGVVEVCAAAMVWGGMHRKHAQLLFDTASSDWRRVVEHVRSGDLGPVEAYGCLSGLRRGGRLQGAGPAFFTKFIYFLTPRPGRDWTHRFGYIMDQWAGCSVNLVTGRELVRMDVSRTWGQGEAHHPRYTFRVADASGVQDYEQYCTAMDCLARRLGIDGDLLDRALAGRVPNTWRNYVKNERHKDVRWLTQ